MPPAQWPQRPAPWRVQPRQARRRIARRSASRARCHGRKRRSSEPGARRIAGKSGYRPESRCCSSGRVWFSPCRTISPRSGHTAVTRHGHTSSVPGGGIRPGAGGGHEGPVTPDERAPFIRGRFVVPNMLCPGLVYPQTQRRPGHSRAFAVLWRQQPKARAKGPGFLPGLRVYADWRSDQKSIPPPIEVGCCRLRPLQEACGGLDGFP
jgi:hypothetical protein